MQLKMEDSLPIRNDRVDPDKLIGTIDSLAIELIPAWIRVAELYAHTESLIYEWQNDIDVRRVIAELLDTLPESVQQEFKLAIDPLDQQVRDKTFEVQEYIWGTDLAEENGYHPQSHWYYYRVTRCCARRKWIHIPGPSEVILGIEWVDES